MVILITSDNVKYVVEKDVAELSVLIKNMLEDIGPSDPDEPIPLHNVTSTVFNKVLEYCMYHRNDPPPSDDDEGCTSPLHKYLASHICSEWDQRFFDVDQAFLFDIILAANYLDIKTLLDDACKAVAHLIQGKSTEEIRGIFNIVNDFTPEEEV
ncbi:hypothetical protein CVT26_013053 [Gymnopilus dilepis]|uniref:E3 ubiquitin ligase complex SCF subunit n=1 Tax=Gymnopilus dilepis TaxID=231916 RepID=A0A409WXN4_9AGAR|nr:hypothetical protein CVT26_013053 [Gymnopilus dilepis]